MNSFFDLQHSPNWSDRTKSTIFTEILSHLFGVENIEPNSIYRYSTRMETEENQKYILDGWNYSVVTKKSSIKGTKDWFIGSSITS